MDKSTLLELQDVLADNNVNGICLNKEGYNKLYLEVTKKKEVDRFVFEHNGFTIIRNDLP